MSVAWAINYCRSTLVRKQVLTRKRSILYVAEDCSDCALKPRCTRVERRFVRRHLYEDALERMNARDVADASQHL